MKILFIDFLSAFNSKQPYRQLEKLVKMKVHHSLIRWLHCFLTGRSQYVKLRNTNSDIIWTNTGAPQGCVLSPVLFAIYTSDCRTNTSNCKLYKYADDTALVSFCCNSDEDYRSEVVNFVDWCDMLH